MGEGRESKEDLIKMQFPGLHPNFSESESEVLDIQWGSESENFTLSLENLGQRYELPVSS